MKRRPRPAEEPELFDLPLSDELLPEPPIVEEPPRTSPEPAAAATAGSTSGEDGDELPLFPEWGSGGEPWLEETREVETAVDGSPAVDSPESDSDLAADSPADAGVDDASKRATVPPLTRLVSGLLDLGVLLAVGVAVWAGLRWMGIEPTLDDWPAAVAFHLAFSFLYFVLPLAFWGRTPGMARTGLVAGNPEGDHLSFSQAAARWVGALVTGGLLGVPLLLSLTGRSLSDRLSGSETLADQAPFGA